MASVWVIGDTSGHESVCSDPQDSRTGRFHDHLINSCIPCRAALT